jgi:hypothetical protein
VWGVALDYHSQSNYGIGTLLNCLLGGQGKLKSSRDSPKDNIFRIGFIKFAHGSGYESIHNLVVPRRCHNVDSFSRARNL